MKTELNKEELLKNMNIEFGISGRDDCVKINEQFGAIINVKSLIYATSISPLTVYNILMQYCDLTPMQGIELCKSFVEANNELIIKPSEITTQDIQFNPSLKKKLIEFYENICKLKAYK